MSKEIPPMEALKHTEISLPPSLISHKINPELFTEIVSSGGKAIEDEEAEKTINITPVDFFSIPRDIPNDEMIKYIEKNLEVDDIKEHLDVISKCFKEARSFLINYLHQDIPQEIKSIDGFNTIQDFSNFIAKSKTKEQGSSTGFVPFYCAIQSIMIAEWESHKKGFESLKKESKYVYDSLFNPKDKNNEVLFHRIQTKQDKWDDVLIATGDNSIRSLAGYRGKNMERLICKIVKRPETDTEQIITDGIGLKFEVQTKNDAINLAIFLSSYFNEKLTTKDLRVLNNNFTIDDNVFAEKLKGVQYASKKINKSSFNFQALKIEGKIQAPKEGVDNNIKQFRSFEIQISLANNDNEKGLSRHEIYEAKQKISTYGRLFGTITEKYLNLICNEAHQKTGINFDDIKEHIIETTLQKIDSSKGNRYVASEHYQRLKKTGLWPEKLKVIEKY